LTKLNRNLIEKNFNYKIFNYKIFNYKNIQYYNVFETWEAAETDCKLIEASAIKFGASIYT